MAYHLDYVDPPGGKFDEVVEQDGVKVLIDSKALFSIIGSVMDWRDNRLSAGFVFENPNIVDTCGCGESCELMLPKLCATHLLTSQSTSVSKHGICADSSLSRTNTSFGILHVPLVPRVWTGLYSRVATRAFTMLWMAYFGAPLDDVCSRHERPAGM